MNFNIKEKIRVKLNEKGLRILEQNNKLDLVDNGYVNLNLIDLMNIFSPYMKDINDLPFDEYFTIQNIPIDDLKNEIVTNNDNKIIVEDELFDDLETENVKEINQINEQAEEIEKQTQDFSLEDLFVSAIDNELKLDFDESIELLNLALNDSFDQKIIDNISSKARGLSDDKILNILIKTHHLWLSANNDKNAIENNKNNNELIRYMPTELMGWNKVKNDLMKLKPILDALNIHYNEENIHELYLEKTANFMVENNLDFNSDNLDTYIMFDLGINNPKLYNNVSSTITLYSDEIIEQIMKNFSDDKKTVEIIIQRKNNQNEEPKYSNEVIEQTNQIIKNINKYIGEVANLGTKYFNNDYTVEDIDNVLLRLRGQVDEYSIVIGQVKSDELMHNIDLARRRIEQYRNLEEKINKSNSL